MKITTINGVVYVNTTPHEINFAGDNDNIIVVPASGHLISAQASEELVKSSSGIEYVRTQFIKSKEGEATIMAIRAKHPDAVIVGSIIAAQAYPGEVVAMTPAPGFERVAPQEKRMNLKKFTIFS